MRIINYIKAHYFHNVSAALRMEDYSLAQNILDIKNARAQRKLSSLLQRKANLAQKIQQGGCCLVQWYRSYSLDRVIKQEKALMQKLEHYVDIKRNIERNITVEKIQIPITSIIEVLLNFNEQNGFAIVGEIQKHLGEFTHYIDIAKIFANIPFNRAEQETSHGQLIFNHLLHNYNSVRFSKSYLELLLLQVNSMPQLQELHRNNIHQTLIKNINVIVQETTRRRNQVLNDLTGFIDGTKGYLNQLNRQHNVNDNFVIELAHLTWLKDSLTRIDELFTHLNEANDTIYQNLHNTITIVADRIRHLNELDINRLREQRDRANTAFVQRFFN